MFQKGDKIKGLKTRVHDYCIMNENLYLGEVTALKEEDGEQLMYIKIKKHKFSEYHGDGFWCYNDERDFQLVERKKRNIMK